MAPSKQRCPHTIALRYPANRKPGVKALLEVLYVLFMLWSAARGRFRVVEENFLARTTAALPRRGRRLPARSPQLGPLGPRRPGRRRQPDRPGEARRRGRPRTQRTRRQSQPRVPEAARRE